MKLTTLNGAHKKLGAKMVSFAGFEMPLWYKSATKEHMAVREKVGLFDVSHMGEVFVKGPEAEKFLNHITCNDVAKLQPGRIHYNVLMTPKGSFVDDLLIYKRADNDYLVVVNASNKDKDYACMLEQSGRFDVALDDLTDLYTQIAASWRRRSWESTPSFPAPAIPEKMVSRSTSREESPRPRRSASPFWRRGNPWA